MRFRLGGLPVVIGIPTLSLGSARRKTSFLRASACVPTRRRGPGPTPRHTERQRDARGGAQETRGGVCPRDIAGARFVGGVRAPRRDVSPGVRVGDRPFVRHPDPRRARRRGDARAGGAGASEARVRARLAGYLHVDDVSSPPRGGAALGRRARLAGRQRRGRRLELRREPFDGFVPRRFRRSERLLARGRRRVRRAAGAGRRRARVVRARGGRPRRVPEPRRARARPGRRKSELRRRSPGSPVVTRRARARRVLSRRRDLFRRARER